MGRYGDPVNPKGYAQGLANLAALLKPQGRLYLATPMGRERVEFNANWVFAPRTILNLATDNGLRLERLHVFQANSGLVECPPVEWEQMLDTLATQSYHLVVMQFRKTGDTIS